LSSAWARARPCPVRFGEQRAASVGRRRCLCTPRILKIYFGLFAGRAADLTSSSPTCALFRPTRRPPFTPTHRNPTTSSRRLPSPSQQLRSQTTCSTLLDHRPSASFSLSPTRLSLSPCRNAARRRLARHLPPRSASPSLPPSAPLRHGPVTKERWPSSRSSLPLLPFSDSDHLLRRYVGSALSLSPARAPTRPACGPSRGKPEARHAIPAWP
jgi:hypothetical protein